MPYTIKGKCIYKKHTGEKVGCTKGDVKKYMAALHANVKESKFEKVCKILNEADSSQEEKDKRKRMLKRLAVGGVALGSAVTAGELMLHPSSRADIIKAIKAHKLSDQPGILNKTKAVGKKVGGVVKQVWQPMALGAGAELVAEPINVKIAQHMEDRYQKKEKQKKI